MTPLLDNNTTTPGACQEELDRLKADFSTRLLSQEEIEALVRAEPKPEPKPEPEPEADIKQAWGAWVSQLYPWQWFVTLTFRDRTPEQVRQGWTKVGHAYAKTAYNQFLGYLQPAMGALYWFRAFETQYWRGVPHIHALVGGLDSLEYAPVAAWYWQRYGFIRVLEYDPQLGAGFYLCKYVTKELGDIQFSKNLTSSYREVV